MKKREKEIKQPYLRYDLSFISNKDNNRLLINSSQYGEMGSLELDEEAASLLKELIPMLDGSKNIKQISDYCKSIGYKVNDAIKCIDILYKAGLLADVTISEKEYIRESILPYLRLLSMETSMPNQIIKHVINTDFLIVDFTGLGILTAFSLALTGIGKIVYISSHFIHESVLKEQKFLLDAISTLGCEVLFLFDYSSVNLFLNNNPQKSRFAILIGMVQTEEILEWHDYLFKANIPLIPAIYQSVIWSIGPLIYPHQSPCLRCKQFGFKETHEDLHATNNKIGNTPFISAIASIIAGHSINAVAMPDSNTLLNTIVSYDASTMSKTTNTVLRDPSCFLCSRKSYVPERIPIKSNIHGSN